ncbi:MAG TPA: type II secretion system protein [Cellvibrionaceae bacterium]
MNRKQGFSLIELLVVLAVVAFLAFVTVPLATGWIRNAQLEKDFAGLQRALGTAKALAMRNSTGAIADDAAANAAFTATRVTVALCRRGQDLFVYNVAAATCALTGGTPIYHMGQDVAITFGNQQAFCGALFDARGRVRLCTGTDCTTCSTSFDPSTGLTVRITGADTFSDPTDATQSDPNDQANTIRAF